MKLLPVFNVIFPGKLILVFELKETGSGFNEETIEPLVNIFVGYPFIYYSNDL
jgi:hypothetical protein